MELLVIWVSEMASAAIEKSFEFFLKADFKGYKEDEWVAICGEKVVAHGENLKEVIAKAKGICGVGKPLFTRVSRTAHYLHA